MLLLAKPNNESMKVLQAHQITNINELLTESSAKDFLHNSGKTKNK